MLQSCLQDSQRTKRIVIIAWLDLKNAFPSVPFQHLMTSMGELGLGGNVVLAVKDIYCNTSTRLQVGKSLSDPITCSRGVKQGCPLGPILFNLAIEQLLWGFEDVDTGYQFQEFQLKMLAYADDLCLVANDHSACVPCCKEWKSLLDGHVSTFNPRSVDIIMQKIGKETVCSRGHISTSWPITPHTLIQESLQVSRMWPWANPKAHLKQLAESYTKSENHCPIQTHRMAEHVPQHCIVHGSGEVWGSFL